jgi:hypothetical protein
MDIGYWHGSQPAGAAHRACDIYTPAVVRNSQDENGFPARRSTLYACIRAAAKGGFIVGETKT